MQRIKTTRPFLPVVHKSKIAQGCALCVRVPYRICTVFFFRFFSSGCFCGAAPASLRHKFYPPSYWPHYATKANSEALLRCLPLLHHTNQAEDEDASLSAVKSKTPIGVFITQIPLTPQPQKCVAKFTLAAFFKR